MRPQSGNANKHIRNSILYLIKETSLSTVGDKSSSRISREFYNQLRTSQELQNAGSETGSIRTVAYDRLIFLFAKVQSHSFPD